MHLRVGRGQVEEERAGPVGGGGGVGGEGEGYFEGRRGRGAGGGAAVWVGGGLAAVGFGMGAGLEELGTGFDGLAWELARVSALALPAGLPAAVLSCILSLVCFLVLFLASLALILRVGGGFDGDLDRVGRLGVIRRGARGGIRDWTVGGLSQDEDFAAE
jgi:hypothetical protein